jgi:hypothetical protein
MQVPVVVHVFGVKQILGGARGERF